MNSVGFNWHSTNRGGINNKIIVRGDNGWGWEGRNTSTWESKRNLVNLIFLLIKIFKWSLVGSYYTSWSLFGAFGGWVSSEGPLIKMSRIFALLIQFFGALWTLTLLRQRSRRMQLNGRKVRYLIWKCGPLFCSSSTTNKETDLVNSPASSQVAELFFSIPINSCHNINFHLNLRGG